MSAWDEGVEAGDLLLAINGRSIKDAVNQTLSRYVSLLRQGGDLFDVQVCVRELCDVEVCERELFDVQVCARELCDDEVCVRELFDVEVCVREREGEGKSYVM